MSEPNSHPTLLAEALAAILAPIVKEAVREALASKRNGNGDSPTLLSSAQVAKLWNVPRTWIEEAGRKGSLPRVEIGAYVRFKSEDIEKFIAEKRKVKN